MPISVADLTKYYADAPPPQNETLADLEARLEALISPSYRSPFKFQPSSLSSLGTGPFGTTKYEQVDTYPSAAAAVKLRTVPDSASLFPLHRTSGGGAHWEQLAGKHRQSPGLIGPALFLHDRGNAGVRALEMLRPRLESFGLFMQNAPLGLQNIQRTLEAIRIRPPFLYDALDAWEAFLKGDIEALDRFIVDHLGRRPTDRNRLAVQQRLERAFGTEGSPIPEWAGDPGGFDVGVFRLVQRQIRDEEAAIINEVQRLRKAGVDRVKVGSESGRRLRKALAQELGLDHKALWIDKELEDHYVRERFPGAVLVARDEKPHLPEMPSRRREPNLRSHTATVVAREAGEGLIKQKVLARPLETNEYNELVAPFDPKEESHVERFEAEERERGQLNRLHEAMRRAGLSQGEELVMRLKWFEELGNKEIAARLGSSASQVGVQARRGLEKVREAARG